jgi:hypothetical protein
LAAILGTVFALAAFNGFDAVLCDDPLLAFVADLRAAGLSVVFRKFVPAFAVVFARGLPGEADLEDFLRDFLDIRLPFVAFSGSIIGRSWDLPELSESRLWLGKSDGPGVCYKEFDASPTARRIVSLKGLMAGNWINSRMANHAATGAHVTCQRAPGRRTILQ